MIGLEELLFGDESFEFHSITSFVLFSIIELIYSFLTFQLLFTIYLYLSKVRRVYYFLYSYFWIFL